MGNDETVRGETPRDCGNDAAEALEKRLRWAAGKKEEDAAQAEDAAKRRRMETAAALGYIEVPVRYKAPPDGARPDDEVVRVRELENAHECLRMLDIVDNHTALAALVVQGKPDGWADAVSVGSLVDIQEAALDLNFTTAVKVARGQTRVVTMAIESLPREKRQQALEGLRRGAAESLEKTRVK